MTQTTPARAQTPADDAARELESTLERMIEAHEALLALTRQHRAAISKADAKALGAIAAEQHAQIRRIGELEQARRAAVRALMTRPSGRRAPEPTIAQVLECLHGPMRERLGNLAERLRGVLTRLRDEREIVKRATANLVSHMEGLMRQVAASLSASGAYGRSGRVEAPTQPIATGLDLTT